MSNVPAAGDPLDEAEARRAAHNADFTGPAISAAADAPAAAGPPASADQAKPAAAGAPASADQKKDPKVAPPIKVDEYMHLLTLALKADITAASFVMTDLKYRIFNYNELSPAERYNKRDALHTKCRDLISRATNGLGKYSAIGFVRADYNYLLQAIEVLVSIGAMNDQPSDDEHPTTLLRFSLRLKACNAPKEFESPAVKAARESAMKKDEAQVEMTQQMADAQNNPHRLHHKQRMDELQSLADDFGRADEEMGKNPENFEMPLVALYKICRLMHKEPTGASETEKKEAKEKYEMYSEKLLASVITSGGAINYHLLNAAYAETEEDKRANHRYSQALGAAFGFLPSTNDTPFRKARKACIAYYDNLIAERDNAATVPEEYYVQGGEAPRTPFKPRHGGSRDDDRKTLLRAAKIMGGSDDLHPDLRIAAAKLLEAIFPGFDGAPSGGEVVAFNQKPDRKDMIYHVPVFDGNHNQISYIDMSEMAKVITDVRSGVNRVGKLQKVMQEGLRKMYDRGVTVGMNRVPSKPRGGAPPAGSKPKSGQRPPAKETIQALVKQLRDNNIDPGVETDF